MRTRRETAAGLVVLALMAGLGACDGSSTASQVAITLGTASAEHGGCGDGGVAYYDGGAPPPCGPSQDFSFTAVLENLSGQVKTVQVSQVEVISGETGQLEGTVSVEGAVADQQPFDGQLPAGAKLQVRYELSPFYGSYASYPETVSYRVTFAVDGESTTLSTMPVPYGYPPM